MPGLAAMGTMTSRTATMSTTIGMTMGTCKESTQSIRRLKPGIHERFMSNLLADTVSRDIAV